MKSSPDSPNADCDLIIRGSLVQIFMRRYLSKFVTSLAGQIIIYVVLLGLCGLSVYAVTQVEKELRGRDFVGDDATGRAFFNVQEETFPDLGSAGALITDSTSDIRSNSEQEKLLTTLSILRGTTPCSFCKE